MKTFNGFHSIPCSQVSSQKWAQAVSQTDCRLHDGVDGAVAAAVSVTVVNNLSEERH
jgi:hypothetical protein